MQLRMHSSDLSITMLWHAVEKYPSSALRSSFVTAAYAEYASFLMISYPLNPDIFEQPVCKGFFNTLLDSLGCLHDGQPPCGMQWI